MESKKKVINPKVYVNLQNKEGLPELDMFGRYFWRRVNEINPEKSLFLRENG